MIPLKFKSAHAQYNSKSNKILNQLDFSKILK